MRYFTRLGVAFGLGIAGAAALVSQSMGQAGQDGSVRQTNGTAAAKPATPPNGLIGTVDVDAVFKNYDKFKYILEVEYAESYARQNELMKIATELRAEGEKLSKLAPGSLDEKKITDHATQLKAQLEAGRESAQADISRKEIKALAEVYNDMQAMATGVAKQRNMTYVIKFSNAPAKESDPKSVQGALSQALVYADARVDITSDVIKWLNYRYKEAGGPQPKGTLPGMGGQPAAAPAGAPAAATQPAAAAPR